MPTPEEQREYLLDRLKLRPQSSWDWEVDEHFAQFLGRNDIASEIRRAMDSDSVTVFRISRPRMVGWISSIATESGRCAKETPSRAPPAGRAESVIGRMQDAASDGGDEMTDEKEDRLRELWWKAQLQSLSDEEAEEFLSLSQELSRWCRDRTQQQAQQ